jgi:putative transposase
MSHSFISNRIHLVFSTAQRQHLIKIETEQKLWAYLAGIARNHGIEAFAVGGIEDHVHLLVAPPATMPISKLVQVLKANSSRWMREHGSYFEWQKGYGAFGVSASGWEAVREYIASQRMHHAKRDFRGEFEALLRLHGVKYDAATLLD